MKITPLRLPELSADLVGAWNGLQAADRGLDSPFFRHEYSQAVAQVRADVEVAVLEDENRLVGFWPFQRAPGRVGRPVGAGLSDFQGVVLRAGTTFDPLEVVRACGLSAWHFDHLLAAQADFAPFHWTQDCSPLVDLSAGYEAYIDGRRAAKAGPVLQTLNKRTKSERQLGPVRLEWHSTDPRVLERLMAWKSRQYAQSHVTCPFSFPWTRNLLERLLAIPNNRDFAPVLSALYFGDRLVAAHFGLRAGGVLHWWFPTYDLALGKYSPGSQLLLEIAKAAAPLGIARIDLGKGREAYKKSFMTGAIPLAEGSVDPRAVTRTVRRTWHQAHHWVRDSRLRGPMMAPWRLIRSVRDQLHFR